MVSAARRRGHGPLALLAFAALVVPLLSRAALAAPIVETVRNGQELGDVLNTLSQPGPPVEIVVAANISMIDVPSGRPVRIARDVLLRGAGAPEKTELNLDDLYDAWKLDPGVVVSLTNLTLSNLAGRPPSAVDYPPANVSAFTFPLWFFETDRCVPPG